MRAVRFHAEPSGVLLLALLYASLDNREIAALLSAVLVHELGHLAAMYLLGLKLSELRLELTGLCIRYSGQTNRWGQFLTAAAGPAFGLIFAQLASAAGWELTAGLSMLLSLFNLLPIRPLDGWQMAETLCTSMRSERVLHAFGLFAALLLLWIGIVYARQGRGYGLCMIGACLLLSQYTGSVERFQEKSVKSHDKQRIEGNSSVLQ